MKNTKTKEEGRRKKEEGTGKKEEGRRKKEGLPNFPPLALSPSPKRSNFCRARSTFRLPSQCYILQKYSKSLLEKSIFQLK
ncbi:hypothetical protein [Tychonema sp. LEGE 07203]|uniref:hypothetical protein n=1 Tax=Tychonema sp. LEGE 07203 TaxID=1828671 RepID=UPI00187F3BD9|nr:hypothetical protein [Tychonema sp. LEGE 07203]MBE9096000.1 hypothetical protein [Tychonema sp. LEGE 07203]